MIEILWMWRYHQSFVEFLSDIIFVDRQKREAAATMGILVIYFETAQRLNSLLDKIEFNQIRFRYVFA